LEINNNYACSLPESDIAPLCQLSQRIGNLLYVFWSPAMSSLSTTGVTSCQCSVTTASSSPVSIFVRAVDVRIPKGDVTNNMCSYVSVTGKSRTVLNTSCSTSDTVLVFKSSTTQQNSMTEPAPIEVTLSVDPNFLPDIIWIGFTGESVTLLFL
jgi:hypothetical protein